MNPDVLCLQETKCSLTKLQPLCLVLGFDFVVNVDANGKCGGLAVFWKHPYVFNVLSKCKYWIHGYLHSPAGHNIILSNIYGPPKRHKRYKLWDFIESIDDSCNPWLLIGDFNQIMSLNDKWAGSSRIRGNERPMEVFNSKSLHEIVSKGGICTWSNNRQSNQRILEKLDRSWCNSKWMDLFDNSWIEIMPIACSDNAPILLHTEGIVNKTNRRFHFEAMWLHHSECQNIIQEVWSSTSSSNGSVAFRFVDKVKRTARELIWWNKHKFRNFKTQIAETEVALAEIQKEVVANPSQTNLDCELKLREKLEFLLHCEQIFWAQRAKKMWLVHGERSTKYFLAVVKQRRSKARIVAVKDRNDDWKHSKGDIMNAARDFFQDLFKSNSDCVMEEQINLIQQAGLPKLSSTHLEALNKPFTNFEIETALFQLDGHKTPGLDGMPTIFYQHFWPKVGNDLINVVASFLNRGYLLKELNQTIITLIPKGETQESFKDSRPISLCNVKSYPKPWLIGCR